MHTRFSFRSKLQARSLKVHLRTFFPKSLIPACLKMVYDKSKMTHVLAAWLESVQTHRFEAQILVLQVFRHFVNNLVFLLEHVISNDVNELFVLVDKIASVAPVCSDFDSPVIYRKIWGRRDVGIVSESPGQSWYIWFVRIDSWVKQVFHALKLRYR